ncbi:MAG: beta/alpha barrel domain-containing protein [Thermoplasmatota archaeon]
MDPDPDQGDDVPTSLTEASPEPTLQFTILPAVHLDDGRLTDWEEGTDPLDALKALSRAHGEVFVIDARGVRRNKADLGFIEKASRGRVLWLDAGPRFATDAMDILVAGATRIAIRSAALATLDELREMAGVADATSSYLSLEFHDGKFVENVLDRAQQPDALAREAAAVGLSLLVVSDSYDGALAARFASFAGEKWYRATRDADASDATALAKLGYAGLIVPAALIAKVKPSE